MDIRLNKWTQDTFEVEQGGTYQARTLNISPFKFACAKALAVIGALINLSTRGRHCPFILSSAIIMDGFDEEIESILYIAREISSNRSCFCLVDELTRVLSLQNSTIEEE